MWAASQVALVVKNPLASAEDMRCGFSPGVGKIPSRRAWQFTPVFLTGESHGQRSVACCRPWGHRELDTTKVTKHAYRNEFAFVLFENHLFHLKVHAKSQINAF